MPEEQPPDDWALPAEWVQAGEERDYDLNYYGWIETLVIVWEPGQTPPPPAPSPPPPVGPPPVPPVGNPPPVKKPKPRVPPIG